MTDTPRLIEFAFPLKQASLDSVHEKNVRHGHISTLHIWPARRPLAACRAALIATLLPDPGDAEKRRELCEKIAGKVVKKVERKKMPNGQTVERVKEETEGGILHWGRETENAETLEWFRQEIKKAYGGRAPKVLDPFAGGGAIPLEAMRLGCEATAVDINPVAWFILKCTLEYPQKLAGQTRPLPKFILDNDAFMADFFKKAKGYGKAEVKAAIKRLHELLKKKAKWNQKADQQHFNFEQDGDAVGELQADLAWHVRAWGQWVLDRARRELAQYYPTYADFEPLKKDQIAYEHQPMRLIPLRADGVADVDSLNAEFTPDYLDDRRNPRWVAKPTVAYVWARTVECKNCRNTVPLLKTCWLCRKDRKRVLLTLQPKADSSGLLFGVEKHVPLKGGNAAQRREHDRRVGAGTMTQAGARCPCCGTIMTMKDIQVEATAGRWGERMLCTVVDSETGKDYRPIADGEQDCFDATVEKATTLDVPFGPLTEAIDPARPSPNARGMSGLTRYGLDEFGKVYNVRQGLLFGTLVTITNALASQLGGDDSDWRTAVRHELALAIDRVADRNSTLCHWDSGYEKITGTFQRYALRVNWDYCEVNPFGDTTGNYLSAVDWIANVIEHVLGCSAGSPAPSVRSGSATRLSEAVSEKVDLVLTDPPYYDAIPYADISDYFYVWLRRAVASDRFAEFQAALTPKCDELVQHAGRLGGDNRRAKELYEAGMAAAFTAIKDRLSDEGRFVVVFAHKQPDAWETLASSIIQAGFSVDASWPIETEMPNKAAGGARLASSVWMACKKRPAIARPGWDNQVLEEMRTNVVVKLREFWDAGIRGPDFVWAATGPALEAYSKYPVVRKANESNATMSVGEFLTHVRRMVVDYIVGQVLTGERGADLSAADRLDEVTAYYLLHRHDFGVDNAPVGACILYATACGLSDADLEKTWDVLTRSGKAQGNEHDEEERQSDEDSESEETESDSSGGSKVKLKPWNQRRGKSLGHEAPQGKAVPLIDRIHRVMHLWKEGDLHKVDEYLDQHALRRHELFKRVVQSLVELSTNRERSLLESISTHIGAKGARPVETMPLPGMAPGAESEDE